MDNVVPLEAVLCTEELNRRPARAPDYETENRALAASVQALAESPRTVLQKMAEIMLETFRAGSTGFSVLSQADGGKKFRWPAIAGQWKTHIGGGTPREFSPCGDVLDRNAPLLFRHLDRRYTYFQSVTPAVEEALLAPFYVDGEAAGTIWVVAHDARRAFDAEDLRQLVGLSRFASMAYLAAAHHEKLLATNEALLLGSLRQNELTQAAEKLNEQLREEITERQRVEAELNEAIAAAEKANLAKSDFLSSMSHDLRTPLSAILGFAQLIDSSSPGPTASQKRSVDQILKAGWYLLDLINEILDLALIESGKLSLSIEPMSLAEVMLECAAMMEVPAQKRAISVTFPRFEGACYVKADRTRVKQVIINLLSNAIKYNTLGGSVIVQCVTTRPQRIRISVKDAGAGLSPEQLAQLFQPFNRLGQESKAEEGTGIGLVLSKRLVELMGGDIGVDSTVGRGSVFWIELDLLPAPPLSAGAATRPPAAKAQMQTHAPLRTLLYVEDNPANLMLVEDLMTRRPDIQLLSAPDGLSGIRIAQDSRPDVILMDINLPGISGIETLEILAANMATAHIPVVALSANAMPRDVEKGLAAGFFRYLTKPIKVKEFMETLDVALKFAETQSSNPSRVKIKKKA